MRVIVTGSRNHKRPGDILLALDEIRAVLHDGEHMVVVQGGAKGADAAAVAWAAEQVVYRRPVTLETHKADWAMGKQAGPWRNQHMVNLGADVALAFPWAGAANRGTADCVRRCREAGIEVREYPEGLL